VTAKRAQPAVKVADWTWEEQSSNPRQNRIPHVAVKQGHGTGLNPGPKSVADNKVVPFAQFTQEHIELSKVVAIVRVAHQNKPSARRRDGTL
jgi:hypothetical protein